MKAILTKYLPCTNSRGSRIKAYDCDKNSVTMSYDYALNGEEQYKRVAIALCVKMGWDTDLVGGGVENGYVFCFKKQ